MPSGPLSKASAVAPDGAELRRELPCHWHVARLEAVLGEATGVVEIARCPRVLTQAAYVVGAQVLGDDEWRDTRTQALLEHNEPPDAAVAVREGVYALQSPVEPHYVLKGVRTLGLILMDELADETGDVPRGSRLDIPDGTAYHVREARVCL